MQLCPEGGGGGSEANQKIWDTFYEPNLFDFLVERGGFDQIQNFGTLFVKILGGLGCTKVLQKFQKFRLSEKNTKRSKNLRGGQTCFGQSLNKAAFFWGECP